MIYDFENYDEINGRSIASANYAKPIKKRMY